MSIKISDIDALQKYVTGVMNRADHHAGDVSEIALALVGAIVWKKDSSSIEVRAQEGEAKNVLWVNINNKRYAFTYRHETYKIEMKENSLKGKILYEFDNNTSLSNIKSIFENL